MHFPWGQGYGFVIKASTDIPDRVRTGLDLSSENILSSFSASSNMFPFFGILEKPILLDILFFKRIASSLLGFSIFPSSLEKLATNLSILAFSSIQSDMLVI
jgi:hypothetical protein